MEELTVQMGKICVCERARARPHASTHVKV